ncbi:hypothetical protein B4U80_14130, partial [Leptotrombidium deliense]
MCRELILENINTEGEQRTTFDLTVKQSLDVTLESTSQRIEVGEELQLTCVIRGFPVNSLYFTKDLKPINAFGHRVKQRAGKLFIFKVERDDQGCYQCFAVVDKDETSQAN